MSRWLQKCFPLALVLALIVAGCARQTALVPPEIHYGSETCADCGMIISDPHYAAAIAWRTTRDDSVQTADFDDIGCLLNWHRHHANAQIVAAWVKNVRTAEWLDATSASYVKSDHLTTPMGSGIAAGAAKENFAVLPIYQPELTWTGLLKLNGPEAGAAALASHDGHND